MLVFQLWFRFWPHYSQRVILCQQKQLITTMRMPNFIQIGPPSPDLWRHVAFSSWRQQRHKSATFDFRFGDVLHWSKYLAISIPNLDTISQLVDENEIPLLPVSENKRPPYWNSTSGFDFELFIVIDTWPNSMKIVRSATVMALCGF